MVAKSRVPEITLVHVEEFERTLFGFVALTMSAFINKTENDSDALPKFAVELNGTRSRSFIKEVSMKEQEGLSAVKVYALPDAEPGKIYHFELLRAEDGWRVSLDNLRIETS